MSSFYDLNIPYVSNDQNLPRTLAFAHELGYNVIALNHTITGKLPTDTTCAIPDPLPQKNIPSKLTILRRLTLTLTESGYQNARLTALSAPYDILALRPIDERTLQLACSSLDCDIISLDLIIRQGFFFKFKMLSEGTKAGKKFEICYSQGLLGDAQTRRNLISNATQLIRATRGRGVILSSETKAGAVGLRGPWDVINLAAVWGLGQERGFEGLGKECRGVVVTAELKRTGYRGVVDVVYGGEKPVQVEKEVIVGSAKGKQKLEKVHKQVEAQILKQGQKRKADEEAEKEGDAVVNGDEVEKPISKREAKRRAHKARQEALAASGPSSATGPK
ncbi:hypothetical protein DOTSEDRAFT_172233 [Dothistroma septosporum NZE10]|uniref:RNase P subunit p30-like protein n=1 Tax=Dothistroma septosporum (strain NZE10 / CBS 128990) TaxID=675120 RepID=N1PNZ9_DOTSN|nr:hypothetical protein DOTSEDRAFT_172233 [Dothistroma septosporum NZE10]